MLVDTGERQVAPELSGIRRDHLARYEWAAEKLAGKWVFDVGCGIGYGSAILADAGCIVTGFDREADALAYGADHYRREHVRLRQADVSAGGFCTTNANAAVAFEIIEHLADPQPMLLHLREVVPVLLASVPNEIGFPYRDYKFHHRHYRPEEFEALLAESGWKVLGWHGQRGPESEVEPDVMNGRTLIATCERADVVKKKANGHDTEEPLKLEPAPRRVAIVGLGKSSEMFMDAAKRLGGRHVMCDEVWGINSIGDVLRCDRIFHMDDVAVQERRAEAVPGGNIDHMLRWMRNHPGPIYTSIVRDGYPGLVAFPLEDVINNGGFPYLNNTAAYAIAYAVHIGVKQILPFGMDYSYPNAHNAEKGRACAEFWLGIAAARGIEIILPEHTTLMDACAPDAERFYGYDAVDISIKDREDGTAQITMTPRDELPTATEIERRYDHRRHPNAHIEGQEAVNA